MNTQLYIYKNSDSSVYEVIELYADESINVTYEVNDLKTLDKRGSMYSKTFNIPGTKNNNKIFGELFDVSTDYSVFDPRISYKCELRDYSYSVVIKGIIKLDAINKTINSDGLGNLIEYEVEIHDDRAELYSRISDLYLTDINLYDKFNHKYTRDNIVHAWGHTYKDCYTYPKYYKTSKSKITDWHPAIFVKYLTDRIIGDQGFSYEIQGVDEDIFNKLIIPWTGGKQNIFSGDLATNKCTIGLYNSNQLGYSNVGTNSYNYMSNGKHWGCLAFGFYEDDGAYLPYSSVQVGCIQQSAMNLPLSKESPNPFVDGKDLWTGSPTFVPEPSGVNTYLVSGCFFSPDVAGKYEFDFSGRTVVNINSDQLFVGSMRDAKVTIGIARVRNGVYSYITGVDKIITENDVQGSLRRFSPYFNGYANKITFFNTSGQEYVDTSFDAPIELKKEVDALIGDKYYIYLRLENNIVYTVSQAQFPAEAWIDEPTVNLKVSLMNGTIDENQTVSLSEYMPKNIKQSDLLNDLCKMFNLYVISDKTRENHIIFKTAEEFYGEEYVDWTEKLDNNSTFRIEFLPDIIPGRMKFSYKEDNDQWNETYKTETNEIFGEYTKDLWYSSTKTEEKVELIFSPTPQQSQYDIPNSTEFYTTMAIDAVEPKGNIRILSYSYPEDGVFTWEYNVSGVNDTFLYTSYPFAGHNNHPTSPDHDLNFGEVEFDYFTDYTSNSTDNNLFNKYYSSYFNMISEGKLITAYFYLTNEDIHNLDLSKKVFVKDNFYYINSIQDFNCSIPGITKVELIKINEGIKFQRKQKFITTASKLTNADLVKMKAKIDADIISRNNDFSSNSIAVVGQNNVTNRDTNNITIEGENNSIDINSSNVRMYGANNISVPYGAKNIVYINTSGHTTGVTNYTTYINDIKVSGDSISAGTIHTGQIYSGGTDLYDIFLTTADGNDITRVQPGLNTYTGGTANDPTVNISAATLNSLTVSGITSLNTLSSSTIQCGNLVSTGNTVVMANSGGLFYSADTQEISTLDITGLDLRLGNLTASTITITAGTLNSSGDLSVNIPSGKTIVMSNVAWRDEFPGSPWVAAGASAAPDEVNYTIAGVNVRKWSFDGGTTEERLSSNFEIPHDYKAGEPIEVHVHWMPSTIGSGTTAWYFDYAYCPVLGASVTATTLSVSATTSANTQYNHYITSFGYLDTSKNYSLGDLIMFNLRRTPTTDTYPNDAILLQVALHVPVDTMGSRNIYSK